MEEKGEGEAGRGDGGGGGGGGGRVSNGCLLGGEVPVLNWNGAKGDTAGGVGAEDEGRGSSEEDESLEKVM